MPKEWKPLAVCGHSKLPYDEYITANALQQAAQILNGLKLGRDDVIYIGEGGSRRGNSHMMYFLVFTEQEVPLDLTDA